MSNEIFEAGDVVTCAFFGDEEFVLIKSEGSMFPVKICINNDRRYFTINGKSNVSDTTPVLKLVRKKSKERELVEIYKVARPFSSDKSFDTYEEALDWIKEDGITSHEYQIEKIYKIKE